MAYVTPVIHGSRRSYSESRDPILLEIEGKEDDRRRVVFYNNKSQCHQLSQTLFWWPQSWKKTYHEFDRYYLCLLLCGGNLEIVCVILDALLLLAFNLLRSTSFYWPMYSNYPKPKFSFYIYTMLIRKWMTVNQLILIRTVLLSLENEISN